jgi:hypothetical protein
MGKKPIVKLRVFRGRTLSFNEDGTIQNENNLISIEHNTKLWKLTLKNLSISGYCKVSIEKVFNEDKDGVYVQIKDIKIYEDEIKDALNPKKNIAKTVDQLRIEKLEAENKAMLAKMEAFMNGNLKTKTIEEESNESQVIIEDLKLEYFKLSGKKPHHFWKEDTLIVEIDKLKNI